MKVNCYKLEEVNAAIDDLRHGRLTGSAVIVVDESLLLCVCFQCSFLFFTYFLSTTFPNNSHTISLHTHTSSPPSLKLTLTQQTTPNQNAHILQHLQHLQHLHGHKQRRGKVRIASTHSTTWNNTFRISTMVMYMIRSATALTYGVFCIISYCNTSLSTTHE